MFTSQFLPAVLGGAALVWGAANAVTYYHERTEPPLIEGTAAYADPVQPGEIILLPWVITKRTECPGLTSRTWNGAGGFQLTEPAQSTAIPVGSDMRFNIQTEIPVMAQVGELNLEIVGHFDCGSGPKEFRLGPVVLVVGDE